MIGAVAAAPHGYYFNILQCVSPSGTAGSWTRDKGRLSRTRLKWRNSQHGAAGRFSQHILRPEEEGPLKGRHPKGIDRAIIGESPMPRSIHSWCSGAMKAKFRIQYFDRFQVFASTGPIELGAGKLSCLLAYLGCHDGTAPFRRDKIMTLLWEDHPEPKARQNLRKALARLRQIIGDDAFVGSSGHIGIRPGFVESDLATFERLTRSADSQSLNEAVDLYKGSFLGNLSMDGSGWTEWRHLQQSRLESLAVNAAVALATAELAAGRPARALEIAQRGLVIDKLREDTHRVAIRALAESGRRTDALKLFDQLKGLLRTELDVAPEAATTRLVEDLRRLGGPSPDPRLRLAAAEGSLPLPDYPSVAVLPFADGGENDQRYFADGMVEDIVQSLASLHELFVIARGSTLGLRVGESGIGDIGRALGVRYLVAGSVRRTHDQLRVWVELSDTSSGQILWTDRLNAPVTDIFLIQDQIVADLVAHIAPSIRNAELRRALRKPPETLSAYDWTLRALDLIYRLDKTGFEDAEAFLRNASEIEPTFALPYSWTAWIHMHRVALGWSVDVHASVEKAAELAQSAVRCDARSARALATLGHLHSYFHRRHDHGLQYVAEALAACPNDPFCCAMSSANASYSGRAEDAVQHARKALRLSPFDKYRFYYRAALCLAHYVSGEYAEAIHCGRVAMDEHPSFTSNLRYLAASLAAAGELREARRIGDLLRSRQPSFNLRTFRRSVPFRDGALHDLHLKHLSLAGIPDNN